MTIPLEDNFTDDGSNSARSAGPQEVLDAYAKPGIEVEQRRRRAILRDE